MSAKFIFSCVGFLLFIFTQTAHAQSVSNCSSFKVATVRGTNTTFSTDLNAAINSAQSNDTIRVGNGPFPEITVNAKTNLIIQSSCSSVVRSFQLKNNNGLVIDGFDISGPSTVGAGIFFAVGGNANNNVTIRNNKVHAGSTVNGIEIRNKNTNINLQNNDIYGNANGIFYNVGGPSGPYVVTGNNVHGNYQNGISV